MLCRAAVVVCLVALWGVSQVSCSSEHASEVPSEVNNVLQQRYNPGNRFPRAKGAVRYVNITITTSIVLATVFLLLRCVASISGVSRLSKSSKRRLAEKDICEEEVSTLGRPIQWLFGKCRQIVQALFLHCPY